MSTAEHRDRHHPDLGALNQPPVLVDYDLLATDQALSEALAREGAGWALPAASAFGRLLGTAEMIRHGFLCNRHPPVLHSHDRYGDRIDAVEFHPSWHELLQVSVGHRLHCLPWHEPRPGAPVARAALLLLAAQNEA